MYQLQQRKLLLVQVQDSFDFYKYGREKITFGVMDFSECDKCVLLGCASMDITDFYFYSGYGLVRRFF